MSVHLQLREQRHAALRRVEALRARARAAGEAGPLLDEALEELLGAFEELRVSEDELRRQNDDLAAGQGLLELERSRYRALFELAPEAYLVTDLHGTVREANRAAAALLGVRPRTLTGKPLAVYVAPAGIRAFRGRLAHLADEGGAEDWELRLRPHARPAADAVCSVSVVRGAGGEPEALLWLVRDATARREAEEEARRRAADEAGRAEARAGRRRMDELLERLTDAFVELDDEWRITYLNHRAAEYTRQSVGARGPRVGRGLWEIFPGAAGTGWESELRRAAESGLPAVFEAHAPLLSLWFEVRAYPTRGGMSVFFRDVTARVRRERADRLLTRAGEILAGSLETAETLQRVADVAAGTLADYCIVHVEEEGTLRAPGVAHADPRRREMLRGMMRRFPVDMEGPHPAVRALRTGEAQLLAEVPHSLLEALSTEPEHLAMLRALGLTSVIAVPLQARGRTLGAISLGRAGGAPYDEEDLGVARELARRAALAVDNARLYEEARQATRAREEVLAVVSHDLRNPLNAVLLAAMVLDEYSDADRWTERERKQLHAIRNSAQQMTTLIQDLVEVVALETGGRAPSAERVEPGVFLDAVAEMFRDLAAQQGIRLGVEGAGELPAVAAERARILQVFSNLMGNALRFTPAGGTVTVGAAPAPGGVGFFVADTGPGIPPEHLPHLFDRFWQAHPGERKGLGLGLAIARGIVETHGGRIWAESRPGQGSTFFFTLPEWSG